MAKIWRLFLTMDGQFSGTKDQRSVMGYPVFVDWSRVWHPASAAKARQSSGAFSARLKLCPDTKRRVGVRGLPGLKSETWGTQTYGCSDLGHPSGRLRNWLRFCRNQQSQYLRRIGTCCGRHSESSMQTQENPLAGGSLVLLKCRVGQRLKRA